MSESLRLAASRRTTAVVLAAGCGSRLGGASGATKCLTTVSGLTLLAHLVAALDGCVDRTIVVAGHERQAVAEEVLLLTGRGRRIDVVDNPRFHETGTASSLGIGLSAVAIDADVLVIEADVLFDPRIIDAVMSAPAQVVTAVDDWRPAFSGTAAVVRGTKVIAWVHESRRPHDFAPERHHKTVNITRVAREVWPSRLVPLLEQTVRDMSPRAPLEYAFERLVAGDSELVHAVSVDDCRWWEIDTPEDLRIARALFDTFPRSPG